MAEETASSVLKDKDGDGGEANEGKMTEDFSKQATRLIEKLSDLQQVGLFLSAIPLLVSYTSVIFLSAMFVSSASSR